MSAPDRAPLHLQASVGQPLTIVLDAQPSAGLLWRAPVAPAGCQLAADGQIAASAGDGSGVQQRFLFTSAEAGNHTLRFLLQRPWGDTPEAAQPVLVHVR